MVDQAEGCSWGVCSHSRGFLRQPFSVATTSIKARREKDLVVAWANMSPMKLINPSILLKTEESQSHKM